MAGVPATADQPTKAIAKAPVAAGSALKAFVPSTLEEAWRLSTALAQSGMLPKAYGQDPNKVMVGIMAGAEVGLTPFAALQSIAVIGNNPSLWGDGMLGLVEASGLLEDFEETDDGETATCRAVRKGRPTPILRTFSMKDAKLAGLAGKSGPWTQYPARMRQMRARSIALRDGFSDVLKGLKSAEEVRDYAPMDGGTLAAHRPSLTAEMIEDQARPEGKGGDESGLPDEERGEAHTTTDELAEALAHLARKTTQIDVNSLRADWIERLDPQDQARWDEACLERIATIHAQASQDEGEGR